jgi:hypothetical protein
MMLLIILLIISAALNVALLFGAAINKADDDMKIIRLREELKLTKNSKITRQ